MRFFAMVLQRTDLPIRLAALRQRVRKGSGSNSPVCVLDPMLPAGPLRKQEYQQHQGGNMARA